MRNEDGPFNMRLFSFTFIIFAKCRPVADQVLEAVCPGRIAAMVASTTEGGLSQSFQRGLPRWLATFRGALTLTRATISVRFLPLAAAGWSAAASIAAMPLPSPSTPPADQRPSLA